MIEDFAGSNLETGRLLWGQHPDGRFSVNRLYKWGLFVIGGRKPGPWSAVWNSVAPAKVKCFGWNISISMLPDSLEWQELLISMGSLECSGGRAEVAEVTRCSGDAFLVTVRNKKRVGYTYELTIKVKGEWLVGDEKKVIKGHIDIPEFSFGELDDLQIEVSLSEDKDFGQEDKHRIKQDMKQFLQPLREKLLQFEQELKEL
ncbi:putative pectinesterase 8-like [Capsicum annuum]|nr:putative pectinesterase 8-like [Capsicum annuum]